MTPDHDQIALSLTLNALRADFPNWCFAVSRQPDGLHLEAYRPQVSSGLYAVITSDPAELREELDNAARA